MGRRSDRRGRASSDDARTQSGRERPRFCAEYHVPWAHGLAMRGATMDEIASDMGVSARTLYRWQAKSAELRAALLDGREVADARVEDSLFRLAQGVTVTDTKTVTDAAGNLIREETVTRELPPDVRACVFWLKNRRPDRWRDNPAPSDAEQQGERIRRTLALMGL